MRLRGIMIMALLVAGCEDAPPPGAATPPGFTVGASAGAGYAEPGGTWLPGATPGAVPKTGTGIAASLAPGDTAAEPKLPGATPRPGVATPVPELPGIPAGSQTQPGWPQPAVAFELDLPAPPPASAFKPPASPRSGLPTGAGTIRGRVVDPLHGNAPVAGAWVVAIAASDFSKTAALTTAADGSYAFANLAPASYFMQASKDGFRAAQTPRFLTLAPGMPVLAGATFVLVGP